MMFLGGGNILMMCEGVRVRDIVGDYGFLCFAELQYILYWCIYR
jgi:hypothetical protein